MPTRKIQMQGRNTVTQQIVTWLADSVDWTGEQSPVPVADVVLYTRGQESIEITAIVCSIDDPAAGAALVVLTTVTITGTINVPGAVVLTKTLGATTTTLGSATVVGLDWSYSYTLQIGDLGALTFGAAATATTGGSTADAAVSVTCVSDFPATVLPSVVAWLDGRQPQYSDAAGTAVVSAVRATVRRINEPSPLSGNWQATDDAHSPVHDIAGLRPEIFGPSTMTRSAGPNVDFRDSTLVVSFLSRCNVIQTQQGLLALPNAGSGSDYGLKIRGGILQLLRSGPVVFDTTVPIASWVRTTLVVRYGASTVRIKKTQGPGLGTTTDYTASPGYAAITTGASLPKAWLPFADAFGFYGSMPQAQLISREISDTEATDVAAWVHAQTCPEAFPADVPLFAAAGDSITSITPGWAHLAQGGLRPTYPGIELCNVAEFGSPTSSLAAQFASANQFYSASRSRHVLIIASGTNDIAGSVTPETARDNIFAIADAARAAGWRVTAAQLLQRYFPGDPTHQAAFDAKRTTLNGYLSGGTAHFTIPCIDVSSLSGYSATDPTYFPDGTHPSLAMYAVMAPLYQAAAAAMLA